MRIAVVSLLVASLAATARAETEQSLSGDRPDFTDGTDTVAKGAGQLEAGLTYQLHSESISVPDALLRMGIHESAELRFAPPSLALGGDGESVGMDFGVGMKASKSVTDQLALGVLPTVAMGLGPAGFVAPSLTMLIGYDVVDGVGVASNVGVTTWSPLSGSEDSPMPVAYYASLSTGVDLSETVGVFAEVFGATSGFGFDWGAGADGGVTVLVSSNLQLDAHFGNLWDGTGAMWVGTGVVWMW
jgi:hypothetical protein